MSVATVMAAPTLAAESLDPDDPVGNMAIEMAMACSSTRPEAPHFYVWTGKLYSRRQGEADRHLFNVQGVNPRACQLLDDPARGGRGYLSTARELMLYLDPVSNEVLRSWQNSWTGEDVEVAHMVNDPANSPPVFPYDSSGKPRPFRFAWKGRGDYLIAERARRVFRPSPMGGDYQDYVGGHYHAFETSSMIVQKASISDYQRGQPIDYIASWTRISQWLPWMKMGSRDGVVVLVTNGWGTDSLDELPQPLHGVIEAEYPIMKTAPDFDDERPFVNSWKSQKQWIDKRRGTPSK